MAFSRDCPPSEEAEDMLFLNPQVSDKVMGKVGERQSKEGGWQVFPEWENRSRRQLNPVGRVIPAHVG